MKQVILVNEALGLPRGKLAAQVAHASVASLLSTRVEAQKEWFGVGMPKVVLAVDDEETLLAFFEQAREADLPTQIIRDAGKTVVEAGTITCVGIGPSTPEQIDEITGELSLLR
ncbi:MAG: peptidyl-tRNA hydrolase Pth2 [Pseudomonadota bacterium]